ncbi:MAG: HisA/HisF-related TIM barrel protein, partial [Pseudomonadota bacterium]
MIVPSIDLQGGQAVQLVGGERLAIEAGDPLPIAERFAVAGEIAVIDLDAAMGKGDNAALIERLVKRFPCRVGGGIRSLEAARRWLDAGAEKIILGTAAKPELLEQLPRERLIAALDARHGEVVIEGWRERTGHQVLDRIRDLKDLVGGFLVTFVEREGRMQGTDMTLAMGIVGAASPARVTIAGGVTETLEIKALAEIGADAQVGMALYTGHMDLGDAIAAPLLSDRPDGLIPTLVVDEQGVALGLVYSSEASIKEAVATRRGVYQSRSRGLWRKGESSGAVQHLLRIDHDCDRDALRFVVRQEGAGFCHLEQRTCFGPDRGLGALMRTLRARRAAAPEGSYTARLFADPALLAAKLTEEAGELNEAKARDEVIHEA